MATSGVRWQRWGNSWARVAGCSWDGVELSEKNGQKKCKKVIELKKNSAKLLKSKFWLNHWGRLSIVESRWVEWSLIQRLCVTSGYKSFGVEMGPIVTVRGRLHLRVQRYNLWRVENLEFWLRIVVALVLISQLFVPEHATKNQPITYIRLEAVIISQLILLSHIFTIRLTPATCSTNGGIIVECGWKAGWEYPTSPLEMNLARCQIQRDEVLPASVYTTSFPSWEKEDLRWTAEHVSMLATKRPFFFLRCYTVPG